MRFLAGGFTVRAMKLDLVLSSGSNKENCEILKGGKPGWMGNHSTKAVLGQCSMKIFFEYNFILARGREES